MEKQKKKSENLNAGHRERMWNRYKECGFEGFQEHEVLELLLFNVLPRVDTNKTAHRLLREFKSLSGVFDADVTALKKIEGVGDKAAHFLKMLPELMRLYELSKEEAALKRRELNMSQRKNVKAHLQKMYLGKTREMVALVCLDNEMNRLWCDFILEGSITSVQLDIRKIVELALEHNASVVILAHNHPNGSAVPSTADMYATKQLYSALRYLDIELEDHYILGEREILSMREHGFWDSLL